MNLRNCDTARAQRELEQAPDKERAEIAGMARTLLRG